MAVLNLRGVPDDLVLRIKKAALDNGHTLVEECVQMMELGFRFAHNQTNPEMKPAVKSRFPPSKVAVATEAVTAIGEELVPAAELEPHRDRTCSCGAKAVYRSWKSPPDYWCMKCGREAK